MSARHVDEAVRRFSPEPVICWCNGISEEARHSSSVGGGGGGEAIGKAVGNAVLGAKLRRGRLSGAVPMPRYPVVAVSADHVFIFDGPLAKAGPIVSLRRDQVDVASGGGPVWRRLDLVQPTANGDRSYTVMFFSLFGNRRLRAVRAELAVLRPPGSSRR